ncbi:LysR family transcriptional regulator [Ancylobacter sp. VNQ12]|uniref:LysR family transcriptional regulator n=1 Tax=Ancylobacter sp. VNQ12 TaxID=3400920 RepID=UPI003C0C7D50
MNLRQIDLNLLNVFHQVMTHRSISLASEELNLSASAVSHALGRLRQSLRDDLFVRGESGMVPTPRALALARPVQDALMLLSAALNAAPFVPAESNRVFRIASGDLFCCITLPKLMARLATLAPAVDLKVVPLSRVDFRRQLESASVDLLIGWFEALPETLRRSTLLTERAALLVREGHPLLDGEMTKARLLTYPHAVVELTGTDEMRADGFQDDHGLVRRVWIERAVLEGRAQAEPAPRVAVSVPYFTALAPILRNSDLVATLPARLASAALAQGGLAMLDPALEPIEVTLEMAYRACDEADEGLKWLREQLRSASDDTELAGI